MLPDKYIVKTKNKDEWQEVLAYLDKSYFEPYAPCYYKAGVIIIGRKFNGWNPDNGYFSRSEYQQYEQISFDEWKQLQNKQIDITGKWYVIPRNLEEARIVGKWFDKNRPTTANKSYYYDDAEQNLGKRYVDTKINGQILNYSINGAQELTFEEFKTHVLKDKNMQKQYLAPTDLYGGIIKKGDILSCNDYSDPFADWKVNGKENSNICIPMEIVETWEEYKEPLYKIGQLVVANIGDTEYIGKYSGRFHNNSQPELDDWTSDQINDGTYHNGGCFTGIVRKANHRDIEIYNANGIKTLVLGTSKIKITISKNSIQAENREFSPQGIRETIKLMSGTSSTTFAGYTTSFDRITIGCSEFSLAELEQIITEFDRINK